MLNRMFFAQNVSPALPISLGYGRLYNWYAASNINFSPSGWHLPAYEEYQLLSTYLGGNAISGGKLKETGFIHWDSPNLGATNTSGFTAVAGGLRQENGIFVDIKSYSPYHTSYVSGGSAIVECFLRYDLAELRIGSTNPGVRRGYSIRLIKDSTTLSNGQVSTMTDYDGNVYDTICIGTQEWISENWKCTHLSNGTSIPNITDSATWASLTTGAMCAYNNDETNV